MKTIGDIVSKFQLDDRDKYLTREFQEFGIFLAEKLGDMAHKALYMKMAKTTPRSILDEALSFVLDANANSKARLFMWKVKQLRDAQTIKKE
jgi:hypothetical protein